MPHAALLVVLAITGLAVSLYLTYVHHRLRSEPGWQSACAFSDAVSCDAALASRYGSIAGVPIAAIGVWFYALVAFAAIAFRRGSRAGGAMLFLGSAAAVGMSVLMAALSVVLGSLCPLCAVLYLVNLALLAATWRALSARGGIVAAIGEAWRSWSAAPVRVVVGASPAALALAGVFWFFSTAAIEPPRTTALASTTASMPTSRLCAAIEALVAGTAAAPLEIIVYSDFQCDRCRELDRALRPIRDDARLALVHRHSPVERACNPMVNRAGHAGACLQARAAICAEVMGRYDAMSDALFDGGPADGHGLVALAVSLELDGRAFEACLEAEVTRRRLDADIAAAMAHGVQGTPTLIVGGQRQTGRPSPGDLACLGRLAGSAVASARASHDAR